MVKWIGSWCLDLKVMSSSLFAAGQRPHLGLGPLPENYAHCRFINERSKKVKKRWKDNMLHVTKTVWGTHQSDDIHQLTRLSSRAVTNVGKLGIRFPGQNAPGHLDSSPVPRLKIIGFVSTRGNIISNDTERNEFSLLPQSLLNKTRLFF